MLSALVALILMAIVRAETNVTIDDMDPRVIYQPQSAWSFQGNTDDTQDRLNKTTHYTSVLGATASLTFTGAIYVYYVGYAMKSGSPPALVPITLQPWHGNAITVQSDAYRPAEAQGQITVFSSNRLDPTETYTIMVTKDSATLANDLNIDAFRLTQLDGADAILPSSAHTTVSSGTISATGPIVSLGVPGATTLTSSSSVQSISIANADSNTASVNTGTIAGAIAGGVIGGLIIGITITFFVVRWWSKRNQRNGWPIGSDGVPSPLYIHDTLRPTYYPSERTGAPPPPTMSAVIDPHSVPSMLAGTPLLTSGSTAPGQSLVNRRMTSSSTPVIQAKTRYMGNSRSNHEASASSPSTHSVPPSPEDTERSETTPPAYS